jgi:hypothetical protein
MLRVECSLILAAIVIGFMFPQLGSRWFEKCEAGLDKLARRRRLAVLAVGITALAIRAALLRVLPIPAPLAHDEFSHLLAADTFAHGRLATTPHPMWIHLETFHVLQQPTYASMYPPAQGLILALGQVVAGHAFWGVWLSVGLLCAAICWMLQSWLSPGWALLGGILAIIRIAAFSYWGNSYWGGAMAATGGALIMGALPRMRQQRIRDALLMALGLGILAASRPFEGFMFSLPVGVALLAGTCGRSRLGWHVSIRRTLLPLGLLLGTTAVAMAYYFWRVTGSPFRMPYQVDRAMYAVAPYFLWQSPKPAPAYHHEVMRQFYLHWELAQYTATRSLPGLMLAGLEKMMKLWFFYFGPLLTFPVVMAILTLPYGFSLRRISLQSQFLLIATVVSLVGLGLEVYFSPHYAAPMACLIFALVLVAMRRLRAWQWRGKPSGLFLARAFVLIAFIMPILLLYAVPLHIPLPDPTSLTWCSPREPDFGRARVLNQLSGGTELHLIIVRYKPGHDVRVEWVYNGADIDGAKVVWARDMSPLENERLINYFHGRRVWLLEADEKPPKLSMYHRQ